MQQGAGTQRIRIRLWVVPDVGDVVVVVLRGQKEHAVWNMRRVGEERIQVLEGDVLVRGGLEGQRHGWDIGVQP